MYEKDLGNIINFQAQPLLQAYIGKWRRRHENEDGSTYYSDQLVEFRYADGTSDSYVKRGYDEEEVQMITRRLGLLGAYRIFTTDTRIDFQPYDKIIIGEDEMIIKKVLPLMNTNDTLRMYNFSPEVYRRLAVKLIYLE